MTLQKPTQVTPFCKLLAPFSVVDVFFTRAMSVHCRTLSDIIFLLNFPKRSTIFHLVRRHRQCRNSLLGYVKHKESDVHPNTKYKIVSCFQWNLYFYKQNMSHYRIILYLSNFLSPCVPGDCRKTSWTEKWCQFVKRGSDITKISILAFGQIISIFWYLYNLIFSMPMTRVRIIVHKLKINTLEHYPYISTERYMYTAVLSIGNYTQFYT